MNREEWGSFALGVVAGAAVGGVVALLLAPRTGAETRAMIREKAVEGYETVKDKAEEGLNSVKKEVSVLKEKVRDKVCSDGGKESTKVA